jgi:hypothetical protein
LQRHVAGQRHFAGMSDQAEPCYIGHGVDMKISLLNYVRSALVQRGHRLNGCVDPCRLGFAFLDCSGNHAGA